MSVDPEAIRRKEFKNSLRGYNADEVDDFLDAAADALEETRSENARLKDELRGLRERLEQFEKLEESIRSTLAHAERSAEDLRESARREAGIIEQEAVERANRTLAEAARKAEKVEQSFEALQRARQLFVADFRHLLKSHLEIMESEGIASFGSFEDLLAGRSGEDQDSSVSGEPATGNPAPETGEPETGPSNPGAEPPSGERSPEEADAEVDREEPPPAEETGRTTGAEAGGFWSGRFLRRRG